MTRNWAVDDIDLWGTNEEVKLSEESSDFQLNYYEGNP